MAVQETGEGRPRQWLLFCVWAWPRGPGAGAPPTGQEGEFREAALAVHACALVPLETQTAGGLREHKDGGLLDRKALILSLDFLCGAGPQLPAQDFLENVGKEADSDEQDDDQPGRAAGQHLDEHKVHPLITEEGPDNPSPEEGEDNVEQQ